MIRNLKQIACYVTPDKARALKELSTKTRVPASVLLREAVDDLLKKYAKRSAR